jgi:hypothetical protein
MVLTMGLLKDIWNMAHSRNLGAISPASLARIQRQESERALQELADQRHAQEKLNIKPK